MHTVCISSVIDASFGILQPLGWGRCRDGSALLQVAYGFRPFLPQLASLPRTPDDLRPRRDDNNIVDYIYDPNIPRAWKVLF